MPTASQLPASLEELAFYNGIQIRPDPDFHKDMNRLIHELSNQIKPSRGGSGEYYHGPELSSDGTFGDILTRPPVETISVAKQKVSNFLRFLLTPLGRLLAGMMIGGMVIYLFDRTYNNLFADSSALGGSWRLAALIGGISGLILYPHRKAISYIAYGIVIVTAMMWGLLYFGNQIANTEPAVDDILIAVAIAFGGGILLGAIVSRIQHRRKKI